MRKTGIGFVAGAIALVAVAVSALPGQTRAAEETLRWGTSVLGAGSQVTLAAVIATLNEADPDIGVQEQVTGGPVENVRLLGQGLLEIAQTTTNVAYNGYFGRGKFESHGPIRMYGLFAIYPANCTLAVPLDSDIESAMDLAGKRVSIGPPAAGITVIMEAWLKAYGIADKATLVKLGYREGTDALRSGSVDATLVFGVGGAAVGYLQELDLAMDIKSVTWDVTGPAYQTVLEQSPEMAIHGTFSKELMKHLDRDIQVPTTYSAEYINAAISEDKVYRLMKSLWENRDKVADRAKLGTWLGRAPGNMLSGLHPAIPVHPGAAKFYKENGGWDDRFSVGKVMR